MRVNDRIMVLIGQDAFDDALVCPWIREADDEERFEFWAELCARNEDNPLFQASSLGNLLVDSECRPYKLVVVDATAPEHVFTVAEYFVRVQSFDIAETVAG